mmetsp:Transcript_6243/g.8247  ORF Transcript_6243/g.8247 Transcript_6243/m.8247 type:complete len:82 (+) Transcript_6243:38-283(+)
MRTDWKREEKKPVENIRRHRHAAWADVEKSKTVTAVVCCIKLQWSLGMAMRSHCVGLGISFICNAKEHSSYTAPRHFESAQ